MTTQSSRKIKKRFLIILSMFIGFFASFFFPQSKDGVINTAIADSTIIVNEPCPSAGCCD